MSAFSDMSNAVVTKSFTCTQAQAKTLIISMVVTYLHSKYDWTTTWKNDTEATISGDGIYTNSKITIGTSSVEISIWLTVPFSKVSKSSLEATLTSLLAALS